MTFEEWGEELDQERHIPAAEMYADWKAEREQVEIALLATRQQRDDEFNRAEKLKLAREKLIGALAQLLVFEDDHDAAGTEWYDNQKLAVEHAHAVLAEVKKQE